MTKVNINVFHSPMRTHDNRYGRNTLMAYKICNHANMLNMGLVTLASSVAKKILFSVYLRKGDPVPNRIARSWTLSNRIIASGGVAETGCGEFLPPCDEEKKLDENKKLENLEGAPLPNELILHVYSFVRSND